LVLRFILRQAQGKLEDKAENDGCRNHRRDPRPPLSDIQLELPKIIGYNTIEEVLKGENNK
jgi:hypothetical protein